MRVLLCMMDSLGLAMPLVGLAHELATNGHDVACVANSRMATICKTHGLDRLATGCEPTSFTLREWMTPGSTITQFRYLRAATDEFAPDVLVASPFGFGPAICAELDGLPLYMIGGVTFPWAVGMARRADSMAMFDACRAALGLTKIGRSGLTGHAPWLGDRYLLQSTPSLSGPVSCSDRIDWVGDCSWNPPATPDSELSDWLAGIRQGGRRLIYAQCGREFGDEPIDDRLRQVAIELDLAVAIDTARSDRPYTRFDDRTFVRPFIPRGEVLPHCSVVVGSGQPATVLGALSHRLPLVLLTNGSGTEETAAACSRIGVARIGTLAAATCGELTSLIADALKGADCTSVTAIAEELALLGGLRRVCEITTDLEP